MKEVGREKDFEKSELVELNVRSDYRGNIQEFPKVGEGWHVACCYNQWGMDGMGKMIICENLEDMKRLVQGYQSGGALSISWYKIPDTHFVEILSLDEYKERQAKP